MLDSRIPPGSKFQIQNSRMQSLVQVASLRTIHLRRISRRNHDSSTICLARHLMAWQSRALQLQSPQLQTLVTSAYRLDHLFEQSARSKASSKLSQLKIRKANDTASVMLKEPKTFANLQCSARPCLPVSLSNDNKSNALESPNLEHRWHRQKLKVIGAPRLPCSGRRTIEYAASAVVANGLLDSESFLTQRS